MVSGLKSRVAVAVTTSAKKEKKNGKNFLFFFARYSHFVRQRTPLVQVQLNWSDLSWAELICHSLCSHSLSVCLFLFHSRSLLWRRTAELSNCCCIFFYILSSLRFYCDSCWVAFACLLYRLPFCTMRWPPLPLLPSFMHFSRSLPPAIVCLGFHCWRWLICTSFNYTWFITFDSYSARSIIKLWSCKYPVGQRTRVVSVLYMTL